MDYPLFNRICDDIRDVDDYRNLYWDQVTKRKNIESAYQALQKKYQTLVNKSTQAHVSLEKYQELEKKYKNLEKNYDSNKTLVMQNDLCRQKEIFEGKVITRKKNFGFIKCDIFSEHIYFSTQNNSINQAEIVKFRLVKNLEKDKFEAKIIEK